MNFNCIKTILIAATAMVSLNSFSQDLIARQAPIDRKLKSVDSLALQKQIRAEQSAYPGLSLYPTWNNEYVQAYGDAIVPESYKVDLTGFCMPTTHTKITDVFGYRPRRRRMHYGLDVKVFIGDTIRAAFDGKVRVVKNQGRRGYGKYIVIRHDNGLETVYGHLSKQIVEITINPALMFDFEKQDIVADHYTFTKTKTSKETARSMASGEGLFYKVKSGDTLSKIASRQGVSIDKLCQLNRITRKTILRPGQVLRCS